MKKKLLKEEFAAHDSSITILYDFWSSIANRSFLCIVYSFITPSLISNFGILAFKYFDSNIFFKKIFLITFFIEPHTAEFIFQAIQEIFIEYAIENKVEIIILDSAANVKKASNKLKEIYPQISVEFCVCHKLQLVIKRILAKNLSPIVEAEEFYFDDEDLEGEEELLDEHDGDSKVDQIRELINKCKQIAGHFSRSNKANLILKKNIKLHNQNGPEKLTQVNITRWNSTFYCLQRIFELQEPLKHTLVDISKDFEIEEINWILLEKLISILEPFEKATQELSSDSGSFGLTLPSVVFIYEKLNVS